LNLPFAYPREELHQLHNTLGKAIARAEGLVRFSQRLDVLPALLNKSDMFCHEKASSSASQKTRSR
jgi:hypothetical protein